MKTILAILALAITASSLTGCVVAPARGYVVAPGPVVVHGYYGYDRRW